MSVGSWYLLFSVLLFGPGILALSDRDYVIAIGIFALSVIWFLRYLVEAKKRDNLA
jgi:hypothetical protein